jgi:hypothetical protein
VKRYYAERKGLLKEPPQITLAELRKYFKKTYNFFNGKKYFENATEGIRKNPRSSNTELLSSPSMSPAPDVYFLTRLNNSQIWPICKYCEYCENYEYDGYYEGYTEEILFTVIEILYDHIASYDYQSDKLDTAGPKAEYAEHINNILRLYGDGYYLEPTNGFITYLPNEALKEQLSYSGEDIPEPVLSRLSTATKMYYRFDSNMEEKKKAINILADILEKNRENLKDSLNQEYDVNKNEHDKMIFEIVNRFNIRHDRDNQLTEYKKDIWYDWMMQYYSSVIITYYKLEKAIASSRF